MNALSITEFVFNAMPVRVVQVDGEPWFVAADVCAVLGIGNTAMALERLLRDASAEVGIAPIDVFDANYGTAKAYHADVWMAAYAVELDAE